MIFKSYAMDVKQMEEEYQQRKDINKQISRYREVISFFPIFMHLETVQVKTWIIDEYNYLADLTIMITDQPVDVVIDGLLGPIHRLWNVLWRLDDQKIRTGDIQFVFRSNSIKLDGGKFEIYVSVDEGKARSCEIVKRLDYMRSDKDLEEMRGVYRYELKCNSEEREANHVE